MSTDTDIMDDARDGIAIVTADHIEMVHERELAPGADVMAIHLDMHARRDDWGHDHGWDTP